MAYLHGVYAEALASGRTVTAVSGTLPVYFGAAPVHQLADYSAAVKKPVLADCADAARKALGYADNWAGFSLCEAEYVHFEGDDPVGAVCFCNIFDPDTDRDDTETTVSVTFSARRATIVDPLLILKTLTIAGKTRGTDYTAAYTADGTAVVLTDIGETPMTTATGVSYYKADLTAVTAAALAAAIPDLITLVYPVTGRVPNLLAAPGYSDNAAVASALVAACTGINGHWDAFAVTDMDVVTATTVTAAIAAKSAAGNVSRYNSPCWPMVTDGTRCYHLSTLVLAESQRVDATHGDIPYETTSNKLLTMISGCVTGSNGSYTALVLDPTAANALNAVGIKTALFWAGGYRIWGPHTAAYSAAGDNAPEDIFDCGVRMEEYLTNGFQRRYGDEVDKPMHRSRIDTILDAEQTRLDTLVASGALLAGTVTFVPASNPASDLVSGSFALDVGYTSVPAARAIIGRYRYTEDGLAKLTEGGTDNG